MGKSMCVCRLSILLKTLAKLKHAQFFNDNIAVTLTLAFGVNGPSVCVCVCLCVCVFSPLYVCVSVQGGVCSSTFTSLCVCVSVQGGVCSSTFTSLCVCVSVQGGVFSPLSVYVFQCRAGCAAHRSLTSRRERVKTACAATASTRRPTVSAAPSTSLRSVSVTSGSQHFRCLCSSAEHDVVGMAEWSHACVVIVGDLSGGTFS